MGQGGRGGGGTRRIGTGGVWGTGEERAEDGSSTVKQER